MARNAVARSAFLYAKAIMPESRLSVSIPSQLQKEFRPSLPAFISLNQRQHEVLHSKSLQASLIRYYHTHEAASATSKENATPNTAHFGSTIADAAAGVAPAVAKLYAQRGLGAEKVIGSGTVINKDGYILTCAHVVFDERYAINSADCEVVVHLQEAKKGVVGRVVDAYMDLDIAIIKIDPLSSLSTAKVGSSSKLRPRDPVIAMGSGIISCVHGTINDLDEGGMHKEYIQTNCAINPGHSGGPLCNVDGEVVGVRVETVNVGKPSGVSFAIPVDFISKIIKPFQNCRTLVRPDFGWVVRNVTKENCKALKKYYPTSPKAEEGVFVEKVIVGSPADRAGIEAGYVVVDFNGQQVRNIKEMMKVMVEERSGAPVKVIVKRVGCGKDEFVRRTITFEENDAPALSP